LIEAVGSAEDGKEAVRALARSGPVAFPALIEALGRETDRASCDETTPPETRLPETLISQLLPALIEVLGTDKEWQLRGRAAALLKVIAEHHPAPALSAALPILRGFRLFSRNRAFTEAMEQIESVTATSRSLPLPAAAPSPDARSLPRPAAAEDVPLTAAVTPSQGWRVRLRRALRGF